MKIFCIVYVQTFVYINNEGSIDNKVKLCKES